MIADLDPQLSAQHVIVLLPSVSRGVNRSRLLQGIEVIGHEIRGGQSILEQRRHVPDLNPRLPSGDNAFAGARHLQTRQLSRMSVQ